MIKRFGKYVAIFMIGLIASSMVYAGSVSPPYILDRLKNDLRNNVSDVTAHFNEVTFGDGTVLTTSPENCSAGTGLNTSGCESHQTGTEQYLPDNPATSDVDMSTQSIFNADTVSVNTGYDYSDGSQQVTAYRSQSNLPLTEIPAGDTASLRFTVPIGKTLSLVRLGIQSDTGTSLNNLEVEVDTDNDGSAVTESTTATSTTSSATVSGGSNVIMRMDNNRSDTKSASAFMEYRYE